ncbi:MULTISPECIES: hypothetical protein [Bacillus]|uniref:hypothetical protein n=1 Tax=Bacillus TaxID=1386 RepID=UPI0002D238D1|nr:MULTISPECIES: hypothetical protein [Bacillus]MEB9338606.1 hypothetical protein [Bacillus cereus]CCW04871.1 hypothetical protein EBGED10_15890 [Bacillus sp. GeD10]HEF1856830.1 hypothetical protein [Bacillus cereus]HEF1869178.1 hypothetical protein [Bacillus cereus]HEF1879714.1 hypothetical protein [Bacillus cereus]
MKTKGKPEQYGWKLKKVNDPDFWKWYENQDNIGDSLVTLAQFFIKQYGTLDVKSFEVQQAMHRDLLMKDEFYQELHQMKALLQGNTVMTVPQMTVEKPSVQNVESSKDEPVETESASEEETKSKVKQETVKVNLFSGVNPQNLI